jgi:hypothetical protein
MKNVYPALHYGHTEYADVLVPSSSPDTRHEEHVYATLCHNHGHVKWRTKNAQRHRQLCH